MEIKETYYFVPEDFDTKGRNREGKKFRDIVKDFEHDFHRCHPLHYATFLFANNVSMRILQHSCDAASHLAYGMDLIDGEFDPERNFKIGAYSEYITVYGIESAFSQVAYMEKEGEYKDGAYPLTLVIDDKLGGGVIELKNIDDNDDDLEEVNVPVGVDVKVFTH
ncbi:hypothetical protein FACS1894199_08480 [Bacteroidia bacterium]|nr:hypothetical protein FACS1894199_08480 [Bacteroidia bacterium]